MVSRRGAVVVAVASLIGSLLLTPPHLVFGWSVTDGLGTDEPAGVVRIYREPAPAPSGRREDPTGGRRAPEPDTVPLANPNPDQHPDLSIPQGTTGSESGGH